ncbi:MAG TPA: glucoamylase family protein [Streptosporangiaceae bacterium]|nr:glucoamylase family protein [Streptosporangiaceae bacterium]
MSARAAARGLVAGAAILAATAALALPGSGAAARASTAGPQAAAGRLTPSSRAASRPAGPASTAALAASRPAGAVSGTAGSTLPGTAGSGLTAAQRAVLTGIARDTWKFYAADVDPRTHLPLDNLGPGSTRGTYTSAANIGVYLWAVVAARDLHLISDQRARALLSATLTSVAQLSSSHGFLYQWYDTSTGQTIRNPGDISCASETAPVQDNCFFLSAVDNGWYASGLVVVRQAVPQLAPLASRLLTAMDFGIFYDGRAQTDCNTNPAIPGNQPTGQMYGGYYVDQGPAGYHNGALYSDPRIAMYLGMGLHQMPGDVWWRSWRTLPPQQCSTDPDFSWEGQWPVAGYWRTYTDPQSGRAFRVWEGHYTYPGTSLTYVPTWAGGMFEALMANEVVPETTWGPRSFGLNDLRNAQVQIRYARQVLHEPVWGMSPSSTADDSGGYSGYGAEGLQFPAGQQLSQSVTPGTTEDVVTPHASFLALSVLPQQAYANIAALRRLYPGVYSGDGGFYDAVNPATGAIGHRRLVLDQSMIMAAIDNAVNHGALQRDFARDPASWAARTYLGAETLSIH